MEGSSIFTQRSNCHYRPFFPGFPSCRRIYGRTNGRDLLTRCVSIVTLSPLSSLTLSHLPHCLINISPLQPFPLSLFHPFPILPLSVDPLSPFPLSFVHPFTLSIFFLFHSSIPFPSLLRPFTSFPSLFHPFTPSSLPSFTLPLLPHPFTP